MGKISNTDIAHRKARRKEGRHIKKRKRFVEDAIVEEKVGVPKKRKVKNNPVKADTDKDDEGDEKYAGFDAETAAAMKRDDEEIAELEEKMGLKANKNEKARLHREYAKLEGFGNDFGDFLDGLDNLMTHGIQGGDEDCGDDNTDFGDHSDEFSDDEELVPMKGPSEFDEDDSIVDELAKSDDEGGQSSSDDEAPALLAMDRGSVDAIHASEDEESGDEVAEEDSVSDPDHHANDIYRPSEGEDIYGNKIDNFIPQELPKKYVPPHLRNNLSGDENADRQEQLRVLQRSLNNAMNRLSEDTLISVAQSVAKLYPVYATSDVNKCLWENVFNASVDRPSLMTGMIPVYVACLAGVHVQSGDNVQLGSYLMEHVVTKLWLDLQASRIQCTDTETTNNDDVLVNRQICNLMLVLCYLYNYSIVHSTFMYSVIRHLIEKFTELDVELLLLILSHCGQSLRSDDPSSLKEIVLMVQKRTMDNKEKGTPISSRLEYMISAMTDLKNNKKRKQDMVFSEKTVRIRKQIGRMKANVASTGASRGSDSCLRITLDDILSADTKGRWWKVGASWLGNQFNDRGGDDTEESQDKLQIEESIMNDQKDTEEEELLILASKYRMNTDARRSAFCIVMGSADCEDAFEKLVRMGMLKNKTERDTARVLLECCGNEKSYNPFYSHLAARICDYQPQCKFTFQLAFWDIFKQFEDLNLRKAANLAKLLHHLVAVHNSLRISILKVIDMSPNAMEEAAMIFLTIFFSTMFESFDDSSDIQAIIVRGTSRRNPDDASVNDSEGGERLGYSDGLKESLSVFFLKTLKSSPKNKKKTKFRANLKAAIKACETNELDSMVSIEY